MAAMSERYSDFATFRHIGSLVAELTNAAGRAVIAQCLDRATKGDRRAFEEADMIRRRLDLTWDELLARAA